MNDTAANDHVRVERVAPADVRPAVATALHAGARFCGLYGRRTPSGTGVAVLLGTGAAIRALVVAGEDRAIPSLVDMVPAAGWDEREAHDLFGVEFGGHRPLRPLVEHTDALGSWTVPVGGTDVHQVAVGPIHAGIIESGHFRFHVVGERVLHVDARLFYKHRGLERAAEGRSLEHAMEHIHRACAACSVTNTVAFAHACESASATWPDPMTSRARTVLLELERVYNHFHDLAAICSGVGFAVGNNAFAGLKERAQRLNLLLTGHRFLFHTVRLWGTSLEVDGDAIAIARQELARLRRTTARLWREVLFTASVRDRFQGIGIVDSAAARQLGTVGPSLRAAGIAEDTRATSPRLVYPGFRPATVTLPVGDVAARVDMRAQELDATFAMLDGLLAEPLTASAGTSPGRAGVAMGVARVESPRGDTVCAVEMQDRVVSRVHLRTGSYANWPSVTAAAAGLMIGDFPLVNKSFELCYACADR